MDTMQIRTFNALANHYLGVRVPDRLASQISYSRLPLEARHFTLRMLSLMQRASYPASDFTPLLIRALTTIASSSLPGAWGGRIPPITMPGRHRKLDKYVASQSWIESEERPVFLDLGCGFPPSTTKDTARCLPGWDVFGVDRSFPPYVLYDGDGHYACYDPNGKLVYLQTRLNSSGRRLNDHPEATRHRFKTRLAEMLPLLMPSEGSASAAVDHSGNTLIHNHIRDFETKNLTFIEGDFQALELLPARLIRCMNVLLYVEMPERKKLLSVIGRLLEDSGMLITGFNHFLGSSARYAVYRKVGTTIVPDAFAFSLDNLRPIGIAPWYTLHDDDPEATFLADLSASIRNDSIFWPTFNSRVDDLLASHEICRRGSDGFLQFPEPPFPVEQLIGKITAVWRQIEDEGFAAGGVEALGRAGYHAWIDPVGEIVVQPPADLFPAVAC